MEDRSFLYCTPTVFVIGKEYEILINLNEFGLCFVKVGDTFYYEENSGVLPSERKVVKIRVPQTALDLAKEYEVIFRGTDHRKRYWSTFLPPKTARFGFKALEKSEDIHLYYLSDVHYCFEIAKKTASYFGDDIDLFVVNGDIGEAETEENYLDVCRFVGEIAGGRIPVIFSRGNHDTRGRLAERFTDYFPCEGKKTYYTFEVGSLCGLVLDCGEDKLDASKEYDSSQDTPLEYLGLNRFHAYRERELAFLKQQEARDKQIKFVVSHVCPAMVTDEPGSQFDIDREMYEKWCRELDRINPVFMLCGHYHHAFMLMPGDERSLISHNYPVVMGNNRVPKNASEQFWGTAIILNQNQAEVMFTDQTHAVRERYLLEF